MINLRVVTYNLRCQFDGGDGVNNFIHRAGSILLKLQKENADVICFQEITDPMRDFFGKFLTDYTIVGPGRDSSRRGEGVSVAFKTDKFELLHFEHFWMSETPYKPASRFVIQSPCPRICPVAVLKLKDAQTPLAFYGVHLDHMSDKARVLGMQAILDKVKDIGVRFGSDIPTFILGDFNCGPDSDAIKLCTDSGLLDVAEKVKVTFHNYNNYTAKNASTDEYGTKGVKIDYIFTDKNTYKAAKEITVWDDVRDGIFLSDHYPISCDFCFRVL